MFTRRYPRRVTSNDDPDDGHTRFHQLSVAVRDSGPDDDPALLAALLAEPDRLMAESVLVSLVDRRAERLGSVASFAAWAEPVVDVVSTDGFVARRVQEWALFKALQSGEPVGREALAAASNWLQRKVVEEADSAAVLAVLGETGRMKRVATWRRRAHGQMPLSRCETRSTNRDRPRRCCVCVSGCSGLTEGRARLLRRGRRHIVRPTRVGVGGSA